MSHITGGGLPGNLPRVLPDHLGARLAPRGASGTRGAWELPGILELIAERVEEHEMRRVFNLGIGFVIIVPPDHVARTTEALRAIGEEPIALGDIVRVPEGTDFEARVVFS
jgi:phosphoribosylformylglycinamidine cyclo-ligase